MEFAVALYALFACGVEYSGFYSAYTVYREVIEDLERSWRYELCIDAIRYALVRKGYSLVNTKDRRYRNIFDHGNSYAIDLRSAEVGVVWFYIHKTRQSIDYRIYDMHDGVVSFHQLGEVLHNIDTSLKNKTPSDLSARFFWEEKIAA